MPSTLSTSLRVVRELPVCPWVFCNLLLISYHWKWNPEPALRVCDVLVHLCVCGGGQGCGHMGRCVCMSVWQLEGNLSCHPQKLSTLVFRILAWNSPSSLGDWAREPQGKLVSTQHFSPHGF